MREGGAKSEMNVKEKRKSDECAKTCLKIKIAKKINEIKKKKCWGKKEEILIKKEIYKNFLFSYLFI